MTNVPEEHRISRYIYSRSHYSPAIGRVKADVFITAPHSMDVSVGCTEGMDEAAVIDLGNTFSENRGDGKEPKACGHLDVASVRKINFHVWRDDNPMFHANILGHTGLSKEDQRGNAIELASACALVVF